MQQSEATKARRFGVPGTGNQRKALPRLGTVIGRVRLQRIKEAAVIQAKIKCLAEFDGDSIDLFRSVYKNTALPLDLRLQAAARVAQFERPLLAAHSVTNSASVGLAERLSGALARSSRADDAMPVIEGAWEADK